MMRINLLLTLSFTLAAAPQSQGQVTDNMKFSVGSGFFNLPFYVTITAPSPSSRITYTLDGSNPKNSSTSITVNSPANVLIDPESSEGRPLTPAVIIRASYSVTGQGLSFPELRSYIFTDKVRSQKWPGGDWPSGSVNNQQIDLEMDDKVVDDPEYSGLIDDALMSIPSLSIATDLNNLFNPDSGIYVNAFGRGLDWERECSAELINPDRSEGFMVNAGLRIRGGSSRGGSYPKHGFRLFFRQKYGNDNLVFSLFGEEGTDRFDKIDLRTEQDYAWNNGWSNSSFVREIFSRDSQRDSGQPYTRSRYYHLYLNGMYWGLYQTQERSDAKFASSYLGGEEKEYDVIKVSTDDWSYTTEATDGNLASWERLWNLCTAGFTSDRNYYLVEGKDAGGIPVKGSEVLVDIDNLIDYMLVIFYTGNFDSPASAFLKNKKPNNFYAIDNREDKSTGFRFFVHDAENSMMDEAIYPGNGLQEDRVNIGTRNDEMKMEVTKSADFHPQWLHYRLSENKEYRTRFADRAYHQLNESGLFSPELALARINKRIETIDMAVIAESARWGDARTGDSYVCTRNDNWLPEIEKIRENFISQRSQIVIDQLKAADLYPELQAPVIKGPDGYITDTDVQLNSPIAITIENPGSQGTICYMTDGNDPRLPGDGINSKALLSDGTISLSVNSSTMIMARIYSGEKWSALKRVNFIKPLSGYNNLKVTELHYHPADHITGSDTTDGKDLEFIEFKNTGVTPISLAGLILDSAVHYIFPQTSLLLSEKFYVVASNRAKFYDFYGVVPSGQFQGNFSNSGEEVLLKETSGKKVIDFIYDDSYPWISGADGDGFSLSANVKNPSGNPSDPEYWKQSAFKDGSPFADDPESDIHDPVSSSELLVYPNPSSGAMTISMTGEEEGALMEIWLFNQLGQNVLHTFAVNSSILDLTERRLPEGLYILMVKADEHSCKIPLILLRNH